MKKPFIKNAAIVYKGSSKLSPSKNIVAIITGNSSNVKTGDMFQLWILADEENKLVPTEIKKQGLDNSICGVCPIKKECYVNVGQAPQNIYKSYLKGRYKDLTSDLQALKDMLAGNKMRFGAYGDLAALPYDLNKFMCENVKLSTAYTHQRKHKNYDIRLSEFAQISVESKQEAYYIHKNGLGNTFRIVSSYDESELLDHEIICPSDTPKKIQCTDCGLCNGKNSVVIKSHGKKEKSLNESINKNNLIKIVEVKPLQVKKESIQLSLI